MRGISLDEALKLIAGTFEEAARRRLRPLTAVVLDAGGHVKAALKQDGCSMLRFEIAYGKAYAALSLGRSSRLVLQKSREKPIFMENLQALASGPMFLISMPRLPAGASSAMPVCRKRRSLDHFGHTILKLRNTNLISGLSPIQAAPPAAVVHAQLQPNPT